MYLDEKRNKLLEELLEATLSVNSKLDKLLTQKGNTDVCEQVFICCDDNADYKPCKHDSPACTHLL